MTAVSRKVKKVFIGSPSDIVEERTLFRQVIAEVNKIKANSMGIQLDALGWEDTLPGKGRPQKLINKDIEQSDLVVLLLWKRWGSPTGNIHPGLRKSTKWQIL